MVGGKLLSKGNCQLNTQTENIFLLDNAKENLIKTLHNIESVKSNIKFLVVYKLIMDSDPPEDRNYDTLPITVSG